MSYLLSTLSGVCVSILILINGWLSVSIGIYQASIIFNISAFLFILIICIITSSKFKRKHIPWYMFLGGLLNASTILFNNLSFGKISVSSILAISLLGQVLVSTIIDHFGLFNMPKVEFSKFKIIAYILVIAGIIVLLFPIQAEAYFAIFITLLTGFSVIFSRVINAEYAKVESEQIGTLVNYALSSIIIIIVSKVFFNVSIVQGIKQLPSINLFLLSGGIFGVASVFINNYVTHKISAYYLTLFLFLGQVFTGIVCDILIDGVFSLRNLIGGVFVLVGLIVNLYIDRKYYM